MIRRTMLLNSQLLRSDLENQPPRHDRLGDYLARGLGFLDGVKNFGARPSAEPAELHRLRHEVQAYPPPECGLGAAEDFAALVSG